ncbi:MAG: alpha/beta hydrolase [Gemmatimonadaceae bacterium]|nr:alpha/beta hydrolase [Gemmatimonadaceae bacterium]
MPDTIARAPWRSAVPTARLVATSSDGTRLAVQTWGRDDAPAILLVHAWANSHLGWAPQLVGRLAREFRLVTFDWRGHGQSDHPLEPAAYAESRQWGDDVAAVIAAAGLVRPTLVGWSVGGIVVLDYLRAHGAGNVAAVHFVAAGNTLGTERAAGHFGAAAAEHAASAFAPDLRAQLLGVLRLQQALVHRDLPIEDFGELVMQAVASSPVARAAVLSRIVDHEETLRGLTVPILLAHGTADGIITRIASDQAREYAPHAALSLYDGAGHAPHLEDPDRFDDELAAFVRAHATAAR